MALVPNHVILYKFRHTNLSTYQRFIKVRSTLEYEYERPIMPAKTYQRGVLHSSNTSKEAKLERTKFGNLMMTSAPEMDQRVVNMHAIGQTLSTLTVCRIADIYKGNYLNGIPYSAIDAFAAIVL